MILCRLLLIVNVLLVICFGLKFFGWLGVIILVAVLIKRNGKVFTAFGTARWATESDIDPKSKGLLIGRLSVARKSISRLFDPTISSLDACRSFWGERKGPLVRINPVHCAVFAPTGVGKGVSFVIPHGLTCPDNSVFIDFKGEIAKAVAEFRRKRFGHRIVILDPSHLVTNTPDTYNTLDFIDPSDPRAIEDCGALAEALVIRTGQEREPHWADASEMNIGGITAFTVQHAPNDDRSLQTVRDILTNPEEFEAAVNVMRSSPAWGGMLARMGNQLTHFKDKELASTLTTTGRFLRFLDSLSVAESTKTSSFDPSELLTGKMSVFLVVPPEYMRVQSPLMRLWISSLVRVIIRGGLSNRRVHFVLDEAGSALGHLECLDDALSLGRGYGIRTQWYFQSTSQLKRCFPDGQDQTLLSNTTQVFFGVNDYPTAEYVSNRLGEETIILRSGGTSTGGSRQCSDHGNNSSTSYSVNSSSNWQQHGRKLLKPEEVLALDERTAITFTPGIRPIWTTLVRYYEKGFRQGWELWPRVKMFALSIALLIGIVGIVLGFSGVNIHQLRR